MPLDFHHVIDSTSGDICIETSLTGKTLMTTPQLNKGSAFTEEERKQFGLMGKLPSTIETLEQQKIRAYQQLSAYESDFQRHIYLNNLHDTNHVLFYALVLEHLEELMPLIYTPHIGVAVQTFSEQFRRPRGLFISYEDRHNLEEILSNRSNPDIKLIVVTDGEAILGIGDQGVGSINIPIGKLMVYTLCAGINPANTLPIMLDIGTQNEAHLNNPLYMGWRHCRIRGQEYDEFIDLFLKAVKKVFPRAFLHWEDLAAEPARKNLAKANQMMCSFNDDIQGTGAAVVATIIAALKSLKQKLREQHIIVFGAGTAGVGIAEQIALYMQHEGLSESESLTRFWLIDKQGLVTEDDPELKKFQKPFARKASEKDQFPRSARGCIDLLEVVKTVKPTILIGCSSVGGAFSQQIIETFALHNENPIILALSNPTSNAEVQPLDALIWTQGKALVATGSPFGQVKYQGRMVKIAQCNNAFIYPGIGLGILASEARSLTNSMLARASEALSDHAPILQHPFGSLLPELKDARKVAKAIAFAVAKQAIEEKIAPFQEEAKLKMKIEELIWDPKYLPLKLKNYGN